MMDVHSPRSLALAAALAFCASVACAQTPPAPQPPQPPPPPLPSVPAAAPLDPAIAQPPLPPEPSGDLIRSGSGVEARAVAPARSRWQDELDRLDADLRLRLLSANEPRSDWLAAELETADIEAQVRNYAAARTAAPQERLYQASLATACLTRVRPPLPACEALDRLADWALRDGDNGIPSVLLADRARQRGEPDSAASHVEHAAEAARFDDYWSQGAKHWWDYLRPLPIDIDPAAKARAAANYAVMHDLRWAGSLHALCADPRGRSDRMKAACARLGQAMMARAATFALQRAGARIAETNATEQGARAAARSRHARILEATARCAQARPDIQAELESPAAATRARGVEQFGAWAEAEARDGEVGACERLVAAK